MFETGLVPEKVALSPVLTLNIPKLWKRLAPVRRPRLAAFA